MSRKKTIEMYAHILMNAYENRKGLRTFYALKNVKVQNFQEEKKNYYRWLLSAMPSGYQREIDQKVREEAPELKKVIADLFSQSGAELVEAPRSNSGEISTFGGGNREVGRELWQKDDIGPERPEEM